MFLLINDPHWDSLVSTIKTEKIILIIHLMKKSYQRFYGWTVYCCNASITCITCLSFVAYNFFFKRFPLKSTEHPTHTQTKNTFQYLIRNSFTRSVVVVNNSQWKECLMYCIRARGNNTDMENSYHAGYI